MRIRVDGVELAVEVRGEGEPVLLVHGFPLSGRLWDATVDALCDRFRCIVPDLRGHGASQASEFASMARYADDLVELLDALGESRPAVVVGLSMGGYVTMELLRRHPDRVRALVLVDTRAAADAPEVAAGRRETAARVLREGTLVVADAMVDRLFASGSPETLRRQWRDIMAATPPTGAAAALRAMAERPDSTVTLAEHALPALVVVGEEDAITPPEEAHRMCRIMPDAQLRVVHGAGHMTPVESPDRFAALMREFLEERVG